LSRFFAVALLATLGCTKPAAPTAPRERALPSHLPSALPVAELVGAQACAECHRAAYDAWSRSPHGHAMTKPAAQTIKGAFDSAAVTVPGGTVTLSGGAGGWFMDMTAGEHHERRPVDLVLASGRQHQLYVTRSSDGAYSLLPLIYSTWTHEWLPTSLYQPGDLDPRARNYWGAFDLTRGCFSCHLSQAYRTLDAGGAQTTWVDLSINCESCHGPGREHIARRRAGRSDEVLKDLRPLGPDEESRVCGQCHGFQLKPYVLPPGSDGLPQVFVTSLINQGLRPDGTQLSTSYQYPGHVLSGCYRGGSLTCKGCHAPHELTARSFIGESAVGEQSNKQCTVCHRDRIEAAKATQHSHHKPAITCVNCHMALSWIDDNDRRKQRTSDHSISIPRPRETLELKTPNACNTCHKDKSPEWALGALGKWGKREATTVRPWVQTVAMARKAAPGSTERLLGLLADDKSGHYLQASALDLLVIQPEDARVIAAVEPLARSSDPQLRALAIRVLDRHDKARRAQWLQTGLSDAHPYVRMETFGMVKDMPLFTPEAIARELDDTLAYKQPPVPGLVHLITVRHRRGEIHEALALLDLLVRVTVPRERQTLGLDHVRQRLTADLAKQQAKANR
jgi:hypothetical protein